MIHIMEVTMSIVIVKTFIHALGTLNVGDIIDIISVSSNGCWLASPEFRYCGLALLPCTYAWLEDVYGFNDLDWHIKPELEIVMKK